MISPSQRPLPDNTQHSQQTNIHVPGGIRTHNLSRRAAEDLRLRTRGHWDRLFLIVINITFISPCWEKCLHTIIVTLIQSVSPYRNVRIYSIYIQQRDNFKAALKIFNVEETSVEEWSVDTLLRNGISQKLQLVEFVQNFSTSNGGRKKLYNWQKSHKRYNKQHAVFQEGVTHTGASKCTALARCFKGRADNFSTITCTSVLVTLLFVSDGSTRNLPHTMSWSGTHCDRLNSF